MAVTCLALSIATNTTMFSVFDAIFWRSLPFAQSDQLVSIAAGILKRAGASRCRSTMYAAWRHQHNR